MIRNPFKKEDIIVIKPPEHTICHYLSKGELTLGTRYEVLNKPSDSSSEILIMADNTEIMEMRQALFQLSIPPNSNGVNRVYQKISPSSLSKIPSEMPF